LFTSIHSKLGFFFKKNKHVKKINTLKKKKSR